MAVAFPRPRFICAFSGGPGRDRPRTRRVLHDPHLFHGDETFPDHLVEDRKESVHVLLGIHDFDHDRQVLRQPEKVGCVNDAAEKKSPVGPGPIRTEGIGHPSRSRRRRKPRRVSS